MTAGFNPYERCLAELGEPEAEYRLRPGQLTVKLLIALGLLLYGVVANYLWWVHGPARFEHVILILLFAPPLSALSLLRHLARARGLHVLIYPTGIVRLYAGTAETYRWDEIDEVRLQTERAEIRVERDTTGRVVLCWIDVATPRVKIWNSQLLLRRNDGREATFTPAIDGYADLVEQVQRMTFPGYWATAQRELAESGTVSFGEFELQPDGLTVGANKLAWDAIQSVTIAQKHLGIRRHKAWLPWALKPIEDIPNPHILVGQLAEFSRFDETAASDERDTHTDSAEHD